MSFGVFVRRSASAVFSLFAAAALALVGGSAAAATLVTGAGGEILGVDGLEVRDTFDDSLIGIFDVDFVDDTCINLFDGCDALSDLDFVNSGNGGNATASLLAFLGDIDQPNLINGCESNAECYITIPININLTANSISGSVLWLVAGLGNDLPITESWSAYRDQDLGAVLDRVFAVFSPSGVTPPTGEVPVPGALFLMLSGLAGISAARRRKQKLA